MASVVLPVGPKTISPISYKAQLQFRYMAHFIRIDSSLHTGRGTTFTEAFRNANAKGNCYIEFYTSEQPGFNAVAVRPSTETKKLSIDTTNIDRVTSVQPLYRNEQKSGASPPDFKGPVSPRTSAYGPSDDCLHMSACHLCMHYTLEENLNRECMCGFNSAGYCHRSESSLCEIEDRLVQTEDGQMAIDRNGLKESWQQFLESRGKVVAQSPHSIVQFAPGGLHGNLVAKTLDVTDIDRFDLEPEKLDLPHHTSLAMQRFAGDLNAELSTHLVFDEKILEAFGLKPENLPTVNRRVYEQLQKKYSKLQIKNENLLEKKTALDMEITMKDNEIEELRQESAVKDTNLAEARAQLLTLQEYSLAKDSELAAKEIQVKRLTEEISEKDGELFTKEGKIEILEQKLTDQKSEIDKELAYFGRYLAWQQDGMASQDREIAVLRAQLSIKDRMIAKMNADMAAQEQEMIGQHEKAQHHLQKQSPKIEFLRQQFQKLYAAYEREEDGNHSKNIDIQKLEIKVQKLKALLQRRDTRIAKGDLEIMRLKSVIQGLMSEVKQILLSGLGTANNYRCTSGSVAVFCGVQNPLLFDTPANSY